MELLRAVLGTVVDVARKTTSEKNRADAISA